MSPLKGYDSILQPPARLQVMALLAQVSEAEFAKLRDMTATSDSVMSKHLSALGEAGYVTVRKTVTDGRNRTWVSITRAGRKSFDAHVQALKRIVGG